MPFISGYQDGGLVPDTKTSTTSTPTTTSTARIGLAGDQAAAQDAASARARIEAIYRNRGVPIPPNIDGLVANAVGNPGYFETVRKHAERDAMNLGISPGMTDPELNATAEAEPETRDFAAEAQTLFWWMPKPVLDRLGELYVEWGGDAALALEALRGDSAFYDTYFPGNRRADGTLRFDEQGYMAQISGYEEALNAYGIAPDIFRHRFADLVAGGVDANEFLDRMRQNYVMVASQSHQIRRWFADHFGSGNISDAAILTSLIDPSIDVVTAQHMLQQAQVGGAAAEQGFDIGVGDANRLVDHGLDLAAARNLFGQASRMLPTIKSLMDRHNDPEDDFDLDEYLDAVVFLDPDKAKAIERVFRREGATFSERNLLSRGRRGQLRGLRAL